MSDHQEPSTFEKVQDYVNMYFAHVEKKIDDKFERSDKKFEEKFNKIDIKIDNGFDKIDNKIERQFEKYDHVRIDTNKNSTLIEERTEDLPKIRKNISVNETQVNNLKKAFWVSVGGIFAGYSTLLYFCIKEFLKIWEHLK